MKIQIMTTLKTDCEIVKHKIVENDFTDEFCLVVKYADGEIDRDYFESYSDAKKCLNYLKIKGE